MTDVPTPRTDAMVFAADKYIPAVARELCWELEREIAQQAASIDALTKALEAIRDNTTDLIPPFRALGTSGPVRDVAIAALKE